MTTQTNRLKKRFGSAIRLGADCDLAADLCVEIGQEALLVLGDRVSIRRGCTIQVHRGATVVVGHNVAIGENTFISAMVGIRIGDGVGISNMVDLHDHNHRERSIANLVDGELTPWASGFAGAPIVIEPGAIISNKVSITAGVRIGQNTIVGANSTVTRSIGANTVALGSPAIAQRTFDAVLSDAQPRLKVAFAWFGTSIMEHLEGYNSQMTTQSALPAVGTTVEVQGWRNRGYVHRLQTTLQTRWPYIDIVFHNHGKGGATSRDIWKSVHAETVSTFPAVSVLGCGINDVWRGFQGRHAEAVGPEEFGANYRGMIEALKARSRSVVCIGEAPIGWDDTIDVGAANVVLQRYNALATQAAAEAGAAFIDVWPSFTVVSRQFGGNRALSLWSDGVHLSEHGDALLHDLVDAHLRDKRTIEAMTTYAVQERQNAIETFRPLFEEVRGVTGNAQQPLTGDDTRDATS